jgi:type III secretion system YscD/HrpQ family protein
MSENPSVPEPFELIPSKSKETANRSDNREEPVEESESNQAVESAQEEEKHDTIFSEEGEKPSPRAQGGFADIDFDLIDSGRYLLKVVGGPNNGAEFSMHTGESYLIGTDPNSCDIVFHDTSVSRQHAKIFIDPEGSVQIEDLNSKNGVLIDGKAIQGKAAVPHSSVVTIGTSSFILYDREGNMQTIISPLLPDIVKALNKEEVKEEAAVASDAEALQLPPVKKERPLGAFIAIAIITGLFVLVAIGVNNLFKEQPVQLVDTSQAEKQLAEALSPFKAVKYSFNKDTGRLLLVGHVLTPAEKTQLLYNLQGLKFIKNTDDNGVVIDEYVWENTNAILNRNSAWKGITIQSPEAGKFVLTGYLDNRKQAEQLYHYITDNFPYLDRLEKNLVVDEEVQQKVTSMLTNIGIRSITVQFSDGILNLTGGVPASKQDAYLQLENEFKTIPGVRQVQSQVANLVTDQSTMNISDRYEVSGYSQQGSRINVVINGRIVTVGDTLDGLTIKSISPNTILLEKDNVPYRIDYNR